MVRFWLFASLYLVGGCHQLFGLDPVPEPPTSDSLLPDTPLGQCGHRSVAAGRSHSCAIDIDGAVWCWGKNEDWQVKPGAGDIVLDPVRIDVLPSAAVQIAAGRSVSCARLIDGSVWCWGKNADGELGVGTQDERLAPNPVGLAPGERAIDVDVGAYHVCIRRESDSAVMCWGSNGFKEIGTTTGTTFPQPTLVGGTAGMSRLAVGHRHSCGISASGTVQCWGKGDEGQLGSGTVTTPTLTEAVGIEGASGLTAAGRSTCAVVGGIVRCWGSNDHGQLGTGAFIDADAPGSIVASNASEVVLGTAGACSLRTDGAVECWGGLPPGDGTFSTSVVPRPSSVTSATALTAGFHHACAIVDGQIQCWGDNSFGALGRGTRDLALMPAAVTLPATVAAVSVGTESACALLTDGGVACWGDNRYGELGDGTRSSLHAVVKVATGITSVVGVATRYERACAWNATSARCWGKNSYGILGNGAGSRDRALPVAVTVASNLKSIALGTSHTCAITSTDAVQCWGHNVHGQLGNNTTNDSTSAVTASNGPILQLVAGTNHTCARKSDATIICWGQNADGQLGNNATTDSDSPVTISGFSGATDLSAGRRHTCAISSGTLYCWGNNDHGQLGLGDHTDRLTPVAVVLPASAVDVELGHDTSCVRVVGGKVYCWGEGDSGQLGNGTTPISQVMPTELPLAGATAMSVNRAGGCGIRGGGLECWGKAALLADGNVSSAEPHPTSLACP